MKTTASGDAQRRQRAREARDAFPAMGVYAVRETRDGWVRVGASRNVPGMLNRIRFELRHGSHPSTIRFEVLELLRQREDLAFDYDAELNELAAIYRAELCAPAAR
jgi:hypothetical protein